MGRAGWTVIHLLPDINGGGGGGGVDTGKRITFISHLKQYAFHQQIIQSGFSHSHHLAHEK